MRLFRRRNRGPIYGPPLPACGARRSYPWWHECEYELGHDGRHGRLIGRSSSKGGLIESTSTTWEVWA